MIGIIDYGAGNIRSVRNAILRVADKENIKVVVSNDIEILSECDKLILPGVGAFGDVMKNLKEAGISEFIKNWVKKSKPFIGICIGLQVLFEIGHEMGTHEGLGILKGEVIMFQKPDIIVPHMGWNTIEVVKESPFVTKEDNGKYFYFVHSYYAKPKDITIINTLTDYEGEKFASSIYIDNIFALQFHPEKSHLNGEEIIRRILK